MRMWHGALLGWGYIMAAYVGAQLLGRDFLIAMMLAGVWAITGAFLVWAITHRRAD